MLLTLLACLLAATPTSTTGEPEIQTILARPGQTLADVAPAGFVYQQDDADPGVWPEGDLMGWAAFTLDGAKVILTNRATANITVFNVATMAAETTVDVGSFPTAIAVTDSFAVITRAFADSVVIVRLSDWSIAARLPSGVQPWVVRLNQDRTLAYVACDISNTCEVYDLTTLTRVRTLANFPVFLMVYSWNSENGRWTALFSDFEVTPDGSHIIAPNGLDSLFWIDTQTGAADDTLTGIGSCFFIRLSGDSTKAVVANTANPCVASQIDIASHVVTATVAITGHTLSTMGGCVNGDGSKAYFGTSDNSSTIVRFATSDFVNFTQTYTAFWIGVSPDHTRAVSGNFRFSIIDFATDSMLGQHQGNAQSYGAVAPAGSAVVAYDPHRHEGLYFYDYANPVPAYRGTTVSGTAPEGDCPHRVAITPDGMKAVCTNVLSDNASIIDLVGDTVQAVLPIGDRPYDAAITSDSRWAVVAGINSNTVVVLDLSNNSVAATLSVGSGSGAVAIAPDDSFAYVANIGSNTVSAIRLQGASSHVVADIPVGELSMLWACYGIPSGLAVSPTGAYTLVAVSYDDVVKVIDNGTNTVASTLTVGDYPVCIAFDATGDYAVVTNYFSNSYSVMRIAGDSSSVVGTFACGAGPLRLALNPNADEVGIATLTARTLVCVNPRTGAQTRSFSYSSYGSPTDVRFDENGEPIVLTGAIGDFYGHVHRGTDHAVLPGPPTELDYEVNRGIAAVAMPGPDFVTLITWPMGVADLRAVRPGRLDFTITPNPARSAVTVHLATGPLNHPVALRVYDASGRLVLTHALSHSTGNSLVVDVSGLPAGTYVCRLSDNGASATRPLVVAR